MLGKYDLMAFVSTAEAAKARSFYEEKLGKEVVFERYEGLEQDDEL